MQKLKNILDSLLIVNFFILFTVAPFSKYVAPVTLIAGVILWLLISIIKAGLNSEKLTLGVFFLTKDTSFFCGQRKYILYFIIAGIFSIIFSTNPYHSQSIFFNRYAIYCTAYFLGIIFLKINKKNIFIISVFNSGHYFLGNGRSPRYFTWNK